MSHQASLHTWHVRWRWRSTWTLDLLSHQPKMSSDSKHCTTSKEKAMGWQCSHSTRRSCRERVCVRTSPWPHTTQRIKKRTTTRAREDKWIDVNCSSSTAAPCEEGERERETVSMSFIFLPKKKSQRQRGQMLLLGGTERRSTSFLHAIYIHPIHVSGIQDIKIRPKYLNTLIFGVFLLHYVHVWISIYLH
jgi:hypothetical protein